MLPFFDSLRGVDYPSLVVRLLLAVVCSAAIGIERSMKNRPAGFRTHILVCLGGAVAAATGNYLYLGLHLPADVTRISGQVITGLGFIGAGTIIVTKASDIKGLTTAAGLWTTGIIGLALGSGYYEGGILATLLVLITETALARLGKRFRIRPKYSIILHYRDKVVLDAVLRSCSDQHISLRRLLVRQAGEKSDDYEAVLVLQGVKNPGDALQSISCIPGILSARLNEEEE